MSEDDRREMIITAVRHAMNQFGVRRLTVSDVALEAGLSRQTIYEYFPNREALVEAALEAGGRDLIDAAEHRVPADAPPVDRLAAVIETILRYFQTSPLWSVEAKRAEFVPYVTLTGGVFGAAAVVALRERMAGWWPDSDPGRLTIAADSTVRVLISHGLAPDDTPPKNLAGHLAAVLAGSLDPR